MSCSRLNTIMLVSDLLRNWDFTFTSTYDHSLIGTNFTLSKIFQLVAVGCLYLNVFDPTSSECLVKV